MRMYDIIKKKRDGLELSKEEIDFFISKYVKGEIPDYQASALCMAIYFKGMTDSETANLTFAVRDSGVKLNFSQVKGIRVDKHSTGGVGDKTSLVIAPVVASCGIKVAKMSGRGLGHTGGTIDKLESIPNLKTDIEEKKFIEIVNKIGVCIIGQTKALAPADKMLYALRDVTATVDCMPLIVSSIMGKKLAADDDCIVLDVKSGSGAFCKTIEDSKKLATIMVNVGKMAGKKMLAVITDMDLPLGRTIGNALEVQEAIDTLKGKGSEDFTYICKSLATDMLYLAGKGTLDECKQMVDRVINDGSALETLKKMITCQGGDANCVDDYSLFPQAKYSEDVFSNADGYITKVNTEEYGISSLLLGAGRNTKEDKIDYGAGIILYKKTGDKVYKGEKIATLKTNDFSKISQAKERFIKATIIENKKPVVRPLILGRVE